VGRVGCTVAWACFDRRAALLHGPGPVIPFTLIRMLFNYFQMTPNLKIQNLAFLVPKNFQTWQRGRFETDEQLSISAQLEIPTGFYVIKFGTNSNLNLR
jgi:hypothetical protein